MRPQSKKAAARYTEAKPFRDQLLREVGRCEICGHNPKRVRSGRIAWALCVHEIAQGVHRQKALDKGFAVLVLCYRCHMLRVHANEPWPEARQLAALKRSRPRDYDLEAYNALVGRGPDGISEAEVREWYRPKH